MDGSNKKKLKSEAKETRWYGVFLVLDTQFFYWQKVTATLQKTQGSWGHRSMLLLQWNLKVEFKSSYYRLRRKEKNKPKQQQTKEKGSHCQTRHSPFWFLPTNTWLNTHPLPKGVKSVQTVTTSEERTKTKQTPACPSCFPMANKAWKQERKALWERNVLLQSRKIWLSACSKIC